MEPVQEDVNQSQSDPGPILGEFLEHVTNAMQSVGKLKWDDVRYHLDIIEKIAETADKSAKRVIDLIQTPIREFALGFEKLASAKTPEDQQQAVAHLTIAKNALRKSRQDEPELAKNEGFVMFALGIEGTMLSAQIQMAKAQGNLKQANFLSGQQEQLMTEMILTFKEDDPRRVSLELANTAAAAIQEFSKGLQALGIMNLDLAQEYLQKSTEMLTESHDRMKASHSGSLLEEIPKRAFEGLQLLVNAQDIYVRTLHKAIVGDVDRSDINNLAIAERAFVDGAEIISRASALVPGVFGNFNFGAMAKSAAQLTRNLRTLAERSLKPVQLVRSAAPMVVIYFIGTYLILFFALPVSGLVTDLDMGSLWLLLIISLLVSIIGAFGLQATRLVALFDVLAKLLPWHRETAERSTANS